ncbi:hypothetical protein [Bosea sp. 2RAB26]|uniref:hypothetical protein n=1 Tax=Bosea sp. 2RAB26 TaxID=3237476 RepID=UPI003F8E6BC3
MPKSSDAGRVTAHDRFAAPFEVDLRHFSGLEPKMCNATLAASLLSEAAESALEGVDDEIVRLSEERAQALLFGVYDLHRRLKELRADYFGALKKAHAASRERG